MPIHIWIFILDGRRYYNFLSCILSLNIIKLVKKYRDAKFGKCDKDSEDFGNI